MSNEVGETSATPETKRELKPKLRFPEFQESWKYQKLSEIASITNERAGSGKYTLMSITSGVGLVSQIEKFGREIAGNQYKSYFVVRKNEFAYNKSATKDYPEGFIAMYSGDEAVAVPNSIFTCFSVRNDRVNPQYLSHLFLTNIHGRWLRQFISVGARAHGSLNVDNSDLLLLPVPLPNGDRPVEEQKKIADCLSSIDELIAAQSQKLEHLQTHKKGLMQQLFPAEGETVPKLRFPEFRGGLEWEEKLLGKVSTITSGGTPYRSNKDFWNGKIPWVTTSLINFNTIHNTNEYLSDLGLKASSAKLFPKNTIIMAMYGQGKTRGKVAILGIEATTNQACAAILLSEELHTNFVFQNLAGRYDEIRELSNSGGQENLSAGLIEKIPISYSCLEEQQKIADCLSSIDELIAAQKQKIGLLKTHKKGLMQQLFPSPDEVQR